MLLDRQFMEKPWGRNNLPSSFGAPLDKRIGEIWYANPGTAPLPLLVKWLFTSEKLSIQVHPSDAQARARGLPSGKEECWYIVDAAPDAVIGIGTRRPLTKEELRAASLSGEIEALMDWRPVKAGDYFYIPAGTIHAIGAGITLVEVQQNADITFRLYDYGRPRELHIDDAVSTSVAAPYADNRTGEAVGTMQLVDGQHFRLWLVDDAAGWAAVPSNMRCWSVGLEGRNFGQCSLLAAGNRPQFYGRQLVAAEM